MLAFVPLLTVRSSGCYYVDAAPRVFNFVVDPDACFAFANASVFAGLNVTITLPEVCTHTFFGLAASSPKVLPDFVFIGQAPLPVGDQIDYDAFSRPAPVLCSPNVEKGDVSRIVLPEGVVTDDSLEVTFETEFMEKCAVYAGHFNGTIGNCVQVVRKIQALDPEAISAWECAALGLGLVLSVGLIAACIVFLTPRGRSPPEAGGEEGGELLRSVEVPEEMEAP
jgi:hypothetical protein